MADVPASLISALQNGKVIPFVGAGVSLAVKDAQGNSLFPSWKQLLQRAAVRLRADTKEKMAKAVDALVDIEDYLGAAQKARTGLDGKWQPFLKEQFDRSVDDAHDESLELARAIWTLGSKLILTTNYDRVLHWAGPQDTRYRSVNDRAAHADPIPVHPTVWHLHGIIDHPEHLILTPDGYQLLYPEGNIQAEHEASRHTLRQFLTQRTFLFIGFGMEQALQDQIQWVRDTYAGAGGQHYVFVEAGKKAAMEKDLAGLGIDCLPYAHHAELPQIIQSLTQHVSAKPKPQRLEADAAPYLEYLRSLTAHIEIRGLQVNRPEAPIFPITELYIPLMDELGGRHDLGESLKASPRLVILGDPGAGKTTFLRRMAHAACEARLADAAAPFPMLVSVAALVAAFPDDPRKKPELSAIAEALAKAYQGLAQPLDAKYFAERLAKGPSILFIDGLDEAPNETARKAVARLIEQAAHAWKNCRIAVTSRPRAYQDEVMLTGFGHARVGPLEPEAIRTFLRRWSTALFLNDEIRAEAHAKDLIAAVESRREIRLIATNPVMLTTLALLHWNERRMPEQRADLYGSALKWLALSRGEGAEARLTVFSELAAAMQMHPQGHQKRVSREWAAGIVAPLLRTDLAGAQKTGPPRRLARFSPAVARFSMAQSPSLAAVPIQSPDGRLGEVSTRGGR